MKKKLLFTLPLLIFALSSVVVKGDNQVEVIINGEAITFESQQPVIINDRTLVPVRDVFETLGFVVDWDEKSSTVMMKDRWREIYVTIGEYSFELVSFSQPTIIYLDVAARIINDRTMMPVRAILEAIGYSVEWDIQSRTITVSSTSGFIIFDDPYVPSPAALELIYKDENYRYYLSSIRSGVIMIIFDCGLEMTLRQVLDLEKLTIQELLNEGLPVILKPHLVYVAI